MDGEEVTTWSGGIAEWIEKDIAYISAVFSWNAQKAFMRCCYYKQLGYHIRVGGQVVYQYPEMFIRRRYTCIKGIVREIKV